MKNENIIFSCSCMTILLIFGGFAYWYSEENDYYCLVEKSDNYCIENNFNGSTNIYYTNFNCYSQSGDERKGFENTTERFYFTEQEKEECLIKEGRSWRKLNNNSST